MKRVAAALLAICVSAMAATSQNWPQFRGPLATGVAEGKPLPQSWNAEKNENILWRTPIPGISVSSPVVWGEKVFVTTAISSDPNEKFRHGLYGDVEPSKDLTPHTWKVYALDRKTGKIVWERVAHSGVPRTKRHPKSSQATPTPATDGKHLIVSFGSEGLFAYDFTGKLLWKKDLGVLNSGWFYDPDYEWGFGSSPIIYRDMVILQCDIQKGSFLAAFEVKTGKERWRTMRDEIPSWGTPGVYLGPKHSEIITNGTKFIRAYDPASGKELWRLGPNSEITTPTPFAAHDLIFVANGYAPIQPIYVVRPGASGDLTLKGDATSSEWVAWSTKRGAPYTPTPIVYGDYLYICNNQGVLSVYEAKTGKRLYQERIAGRGGAFSASPVAGDGKVYFPSEDGEIHVIKAGPKYELLATNPIGEVLMATPALSDGVIFVRGMKSVMAIGPQPPTLEKAPGAK